MIMIINVCGDGFISIQRKFAMKHVGGRERLFKRSNWWTKLIKYEKISIQISELGSLIKFCTLRNPYIYYEANPCICVCRRI